MATNDQVTRTSGFSAFGNAIAAGLISAATVVGGIFLTGNIHFDITQNANPAISAGTGTIFRSYDGQVSTVATNSGGRVNYVSMSVTNPSTGTEAILSLAVDVNKLGTTGNDITCGKGPPSFTNSGTAVVGESGVFFFKHKAASSGSTITASGNNLPLLLPSGWQARCWWLNTPGPGVKAKLRVVTRGQYIP